MGQSYGVKCSKCNYRKFFQLGIGMAYSPGHVFEENYCRNGDKPMLESLVKSKKIKDYAFKLIKAGGKPGVGYGHSVYMCPKCNELYGRFYFSIETPHEIYEPEYHCSKCKSVLIRVNLKSKAGKFKLLNMDNKIIPWKCPSCENNILGPDLEEAFIMWD